MTALEIGYKNIAIAGLREFSSSHETVMAGATLYTKRESVCAPLEESDGAPTISRTTGLHCIFFTTTTKKFSWNICHSTYLLGAPDLTKDGQPECNTWTL